MKSVMFLLIALLALNLTSCLTVTVHQGDVIDGDIASGPVDSYSENSTIIIQQATDGVAPKIYLEKLTATGDELAGIRFEIEKYDEASNQYQYVEGGYKYAVVNEGGQLIYKDAVALTEDDGKPILLDLSDTNLNYPLKLRVEAIQRDGSSKLIESKYFQWPKTFPMGSGPR